MSNNKEKKDDLQQVNEALSRSEQFIEKNQKNILIAIALIVVLVSGVLLFRHSYLIPKEKEAQEMIYEGEQYFALDSFQVAITGDGADFIGFEGIMDEYRVTKTAKLAAAYAGLSYKGLGDYETAITYLNKCKADDIIISPALLGAIGDCYVELKEYGKAATFFEKAATVENELLAPVFLMKAATVYEKEGKFSKAEKAYETIQTKYPLTPEGQEVEKYIQRVKTLN
jgi:tetratricopeptide (TPR) repeat protein